MAGQTTIHIIGNLTADPELQFTPNGAAVVNFSVAATARVVDPATNQWGDGETTYWRCSAWEQLAENIAESLTRGMRVVVVGRLKERKFTTRDGQDRVVTEVQVDAIGPDLKWATAKVTRTRTGARQAPAPRAAETGTVAAGARKGETAPF